MSNISLTNPQNVKELLLQSTPKLGGIVDLQIFGNLESIVCGNNDIEEFKNSNLISSLKTIDCSNNQLIGTMFPVNNNPNLETLRVNNNTFSNEFPSVSYNGSLSLLDASFNTFTGDVPNLYGTILSTAYFNDNNFDSLPKAQKIDIDLTQGSGTFSEGDTVTQLVQGTFIITGVVENIETVGSIQTFYLTGITDDKDGSLLFSSGVDYDDVTNGVASYPVVDSSIVNVITDTINIFHIQNNSIVADIQDFFQPVYNSTPSLTDFRCSNNSLNGTIIDLDRFPNLSNFDCSSNNIANFSGNITSILLSFNAQNNVLNQSAVDLILSTFDSVGHSGGTLLLDGTGNASPTNGTSNINYTSLIGKGWTVQVN